jgi:hypothetical protein
MVNIAETPALLRALSDIIEFGVVDTTPRKTHFLTG